MLGKTERGLIQLIQRREDDIKKGKDFDPRHDRIIINNLLVLIRNLDRGPDEKQELMMYFPEEKANGMGMEPENAN